MRLLIRNFRSWWQVPRRAGEPLEHRQVSFLELFYDLVYVVIIAQLSHTFSHDITWEGVKNFSFMFILVWWSWINGTLYHDIHGNNDVRTRVFTFAQMFSVVLMAIFAHNAIGDCSKGFALSYALFQFIISILWWRTGVHEEEHRPLSTPYVFFFLVNTILFVVSVFIEEPVRYYIWLIALVISIILPLSVLAVSRKNPATKAQVDIITDISPSLVERFGLFTIIVLGEVVVGVVSGASKLHTTNSLIITALLGTLIAIGIWWVYFDFISHRIPKSGIRHYSLWYYLHLPMTIGITSTGAALVNIIEHINEPVQHDTHWLLTISLSVILICISLILKTVRQTEDRKAIDKTGSISMFISALALFGLGFIELSSKAFLAIASVILLVPVFIGFVLWLRTIEKRKQV